MTKKLVSKKVKIILVVIFVITSLISTMVLLKANTADEQKVSDLLNKMTIDEKIGQMLQPARDSITVNDIKNYYFGSVLSGGGSVPYPNDKAAWTKMINEYQNAAKSTRLKIPILYGVDAVHGHNNVFGTTIFPHNIGLGATKDSELVKNIGKITAQEVAATGVNWSFSPCIAVPQDIRWGRTYEGFSEDTKLVTTLGKAYIEGFQGNIKNNPIGCAKHFIGDGGTENGKNEGNCKMTDEEIREKFLPPYEAAVKAGVKSIMISYNSINNVKCHISKKYITDILKTELGFKGIVISDWDAIYKLNLEDKEAIKASLNAGIDMFMISKTDKWKAFITTTKQLVANGDVSEARINDAVRRILTVKSDIGLLDAYPDPSGDYGTAANRAVAREAVRKSLVLLKDKDNIVSNLKNKNKIFVAGKNADNLGNQCGGWTISWQGSSGKITTGTTILQGIKDIVGSKKTINYSANGSGAAGNDVAIVVVGEKPYAETEGDRTSLNLDSTDLTAIENIQKNNIPMILVLVSGRPMIITDLVSKFDGIVAAWLPGTEGAGVAEVLFGDYEFTGKLPYTWPKSLESLHKDPLYELGYGLNKNSVK